jgi:hypothetical protein
MPLHARVPRDAFLRCTQLVAALAAITLLAACSSSSDSTGVRSPTGSSLAFTTGARGASAALAAAVPVVSDSDTLDLSAITVVIDRASLKAAQNDSCAFDDDDGDEDHDGQHNLVPGAVFDWSHHRDGMGDSTHHDGMGDSTHHNGMGDDSTHHHVGFCGEVRVGPTIVDLPVDGSVVTIPGNTVPPGTFSEIDLRISLARFQGTFNSMAFDVTVPIGAKARIPLDPPVTVAADSSVAITVNLPVNSWFVKPDSSLIDPNQLRSNPMLQAILRMNIAKSIHAFADANHDGQPDRRRDDN